MAKRKNLTSSAMLADIIVKGMQNKKGKDVSLLDFKNIPNILFDYFIICNGTSSTHALSIADSVQEEVWKAIGIHPKHKEGFSNSEWILLDYNDVVVHIFQKEVRNYYQLEKLWADADITHFEDIQ